MNRINLKHLRAFRAIAHYQHFTRAAEALGLSQPALSVLIRQLEEDLSAVLLYRTTRAVELTPIGREFIVTTSKILASFDSALQDVTDYALLKRGRLRVAALPSLCSSLLPNVIGTYRKCYPDIVLSVTDAVGDDIVQLLQTGQADIGIGYVSVGETLHSQELFTDTLMAVSLARKGHSGDRTSWAELAGSNIIAMSHGTTIRRLIDEAAHRAGVSLNIVLEPTQMPVAIAYVRAGLGTAILPTSGIPDGLSQQLACVEIDKPLMKRSISIVRSAHAHMTPAASSFIQLLRAAAAHPADRRS